MAAWAGANHVDWSDSGRLLGVLCPTTVLETRGGRPSDQSVSPTRVARRVGSAGRSCHTTLGSTCPPSNTRVHARTHTRAHTHARMHTHTHTHVYLQPPSPLPTPPTQLPNYLPAHMDGITSLRCWRRCPSIEQTFHGPLLFPMSSGMGDEESCLGTWHLKSCLKSG